VVVSMSGEWSQFGIVPVFVLVFFRTAGMMLAAPMLGSTRIPRRVKVLFALVLAAGLMGGVSVPAKLPETNLHLAVGIGGELIFGLVMGLGLSIVFIALSWAGEIMGQQMGINLAESFDPQFGGQGSLVGDMYFMLALIVFMGIRGHIAMIEGLAGSFKALPLLSAGLDQSLFDVFVGLLTGATVLALKVAAPMLVTMLVVDLALGFIGKTMPQINVMTSGMTLRAGIGIAVLVVGLMLTSEIMRAALFDSVNTITRIWKGGLRT
jgi:flagellar biosynthetic protein FliR